MQISTIKLKVMPSAHSSGEFALSVYGKPDEELQQWISEHKLQTFQSGKALEYTNIKVPADLDMPAAFVPAKKYFYMDGFSPNLNKKLHIGHLSNLVLAKAFKGIGVTDNTVSIYGDTQEGEVSKADALAMLREYQHKFDYTPNLELMASEVVYQKELLDGADEYEGTKVFDVGGQFVVGIKSGGQTTYFYQDVALAETLNAPTLYLTGKEQDNHFSMLKVLYPHIDHIGLGLVKVSGKKMSSRDKNVLLVEEFINESSEFTDIKLLYNVFAGFILKSAPDVDKSVNLDVMGNPKNSMGLYISYTTARLCSAGCDMKIGSKFASPSLSFALLKATENQKPNVLFDAVVDHCNKINFLYGTQRIAGNETNKKMFNGLLEDLLLGCDKLGLFAVDKV